VKLSTRVDLVTTFTQFCMFIVIMYITACLLWLLLLPVLKSANQQLYNNNRYIFCDF